MQKHKPFARIATKLRKWPIGDRLKFAFGLLVLVQVISGIVTLFQFSKINQDISQLVTVEEPLEESVLEMEIKAGEIARAVLDYVRDRNQKHLTKLILSRDGFAENYSQYQKLAQSDEERYLSTEIAQRYSDYNQMSGAIIRLADQRNAALKVFVNHVNHINQLIDNERVKSNNDHSDEGIKKADASHNMEKYLNIAFGSIEEYIVQRNQSLLSRIFEAEQNFKFFEGKYLEAISNHVERQRIKEIDLEFAQATSYGNQVVNFTDNIDQLLGNFEHKLDSIDDLLHDQVHPLIHANTVSATHDADSSIQSAKMVVSILAILGTIFGLFSVWIISRGIVAPILELSEGAALIAAGNVKHRIQVDSQDEIGRLADTFNHMVEDLVIAHQEAEKASDIKSAFLANMSHEIRTPMTAILGFAEIMRQKNHDAETMRYIDTIKKNGEYLLELINDILDVSKIEADKLDVEAIQCSLIELIEDVKTLMEIRALDKGLELSIIIDGKIPSWIQSDPIRLRQILINLLSNAIKFTKQGTVQLVIRAIDSNSEAPGLQFDVIDTGIGMTEEQLSRLFQPFVQADSSTTRKYGGTGLGLTICKRLTNILGGEIFVNSEYGTGSTFTVTVKIGKVTDVEFVDQLTFKSEYNESLANTNSKIDFEMDYNILLAEDGLDNQKLIRFLLTKAGCQVTLADNGNRAVHLALEATEKGQPFDVILMDMQMPELDGYAATKQLRSKSYHHPIIALTAHTMSEVREECLAAGCNHFATKPINRSQFFATIHECITEYRQQVDTLY
ncbi:ATP-binding protein [Gimesia fumaroli]|uniref:histidine kinase n=1 Tax=Gimesia fumaroli TaxID=2527976 RepID=A0A518IL84_9PLAN|nr:ATP-binding protein [Gimesia fumaroli]QDV53854.1 Autoinducer 2 sensor kinase/phosphatase LuxQ [Gimesia fumaroli]